MVRPLISVWPGLPLAVWLFGLAPPAMAQTQAPIVIPPAPTIVASPPSMANAGPAMPDATQTAPITAVPPGLVQTPTPQEPVTPGAGANADNGAVPTGNGAAPTPADSWAPAAAARLGVLNVVDGSVSEVQIPVGGQSSIGDLKVSVLACLRRPPGQVPDAAAFIDVQAGAAGGPPPMAVANAPLDAPPEDTVDQSEPASGDEGAPGRIAAGGLAAGGQLEAGPPAYRGWMVRSMPAAMVVGDASETFRVIDCS